MTALLALACVHDGLMALLISFLMRFQIFYIA